MPTVEKTTGGPVYLRALGRRLEIGDQVDVTEELAAYLTEERGDFGVVEGEVATDDEICGAEKSDGTTCERPADECPYHDDAEE